MLKKGFSSLLHTTVDDTKNRRQSSWRVTYAEDVEAEALTGGFIDQLIWQAVKSNVTRQR